MIYEPTPVKRCSKCKLWYPATKDFYSPDKRGRIGLQSQCRACRNTDKNIEYRKHRQKYLNAVHLYQENNKEKIQHKKQLKYQQNAEDQRTKARKRYHDDPEKQRQRSQQWRKDHPNDNRTRCRHYRLLHEQETRERGRNWRKQNPDKVRQYKHEKRSRKRALPSTFTELDWKQALEYWHGACAYCGHGPSLFDQYKVLQQEHHIPVNKGGAYTPDNILPACQSCNYSKHDREPREWLIDKFGKQKAENILKQIEVYFSKRK